MDARVGDRWRGASVAGSTRVTADRVAFVLGAVAFSLSAVAAWSAVHELPPMTGSSASSTPGVADFPTVAVAAWSASSLRSSVQAWYRDGTVVLDGTVPDTATQERLRAVITEFLPVDEIDDRVTIDPAATTVPPSIRIPIGDILEGDSAVRVEFLPVIRRLGSGLRHEADAVVVLDGRGAESGSVAVESIRARLSASGVERHRIRDAEQMGVPGPVSTTETVLLTVLVPLR